MWKVFFVALEKHTYATRPIMYKVSSRPVNLQLLMCNQDSEPHACTYILLCKALFNDTGKWRIF